MVPSRELIDHGVDVNSIYQLIGIRQDFACGSDIVREYRRADRISLGVYQTEGLGKNVLRVKHA